MKDVRYTTDFFVERSGASISSARIVVPIVMELIRPRSVIDVGCGIGTWLAVIAEHGVRDYVGIDGDYVDRSQLLIPRDLFISRNLAEPVELNRHFDLAVSLEVGEHLPAAAARGFVRSLSRLAPAVLFSAAPPGQGGTYHINEQWPSYWAALFEEHDFVAVDALRPRIWSRKDVAWWYRQNMLVFVSAEAKEMLGRLGAEHCCPHEALDLVSQLVFVEETRSWEQLTTRQLLRAFPGALGRSINWRISQLRGRRD
jgi:SAM-dependent methyltransferase